MSHKNQLGEKLRKVRLQKGLTLKEVENKSRGLFKSSVLDTYERGDRQVTIYLPPSYVSWLPERETGKARRKQ